MKSKAGYRFVVEDWWPFSASSTTSVTVTDIAWSNWSRETACRHGTITSIAHQTLRKQAEAWVSWNMRYPHISNTTTGGTIRITPGIPETTEQRIARERENAERVARMDAMRQEQIKIDGERREAREKAEKLLQSALSSEQRDELKTKGFFHCRSNKGNLYRIHRGSHGNVRRVVGNKEVERICVQPTAVPEGDCMLAQKLHIEANEDAFRGVANIVTLN